MKISDTLFLIGSVIYVFGAVYRICSKHEESTNRNHVFISNVSIRDDSPPDIQVDAFGREIPDELEEDMETLRDNLNVIAISRAAGYSDDELLSAVMIEGLSRK